MVTKRTKQDIIESMVSEIIRRNPQIDLKPATVVRESIVEPPAEEMGLIWEELDRVKNIRSLRHYEDMTDEELDDIAYNFSITRKPGSPAIGSVIFYTTARASKDVIIPINTSVTTEVATGLPRVQFLTTEERTMFADRMDSYYNPSTNTYDIEVNIRATQAGSEGIVPTNTIKITGLRSGNTNVQVYNPASTRDGTDIESNEDLARRVLLAIVGNNVGTKNGYLALSLDHSLISDALVVPSGDPLMERDLNSDGIHIGGKTDVYVKGEDVGADIQDVDFEYQSKINSDVRVINNKSHTIAIEDNTLNDTPIISINRFARKIPKETYLENIALNNNVGASPAIVEIISPKSEQIVDGLLTVQVRAYNPQGSIKRVEIATSPWQQMHFNSISGYYEHTLDTKELPDGVLTLDVRALDDNNRIMEITPLSVHIDNISQSQIAVINPLAGSNVSGIVPIQAAISSELCVYDVRVSIDNLCWHKMKKQDDLWIFEWNTCLYADGVHKLLVKAENYNKSRFSSPEIFVIVNNANFKKDITNNDVLTIHAANTAIYSCVYAGTRQCCIARTGDHGNTWQLFPFKNDCCPAITVIRTEGDLIAIGTESEGLFISTDCGRTYKNYNTCTVCNFLSDQVNDILLQPPNIWLATSYGLYVTPNTGDTWYKFTQDDGLPSNFVTSLAFKRTEQICIE